MRVYKDIVSGDEMCSDSYPMKVVDDIVYEFEAKMIKVSNKIDDNLIGASKGDAGFAGGEKEGDEEEAAAAEDTEESVINIVFAHKLQKIPLDKKGFMGWAKDFMKKILERLEKENKDRVDVFKKNAQKFVKETILEKFDQWEFFVGEQMNCDGSLMMLNYREDGITPYFIAFKDGLKDEKY